MRLFASKTRALSPTSNNKSNKGAQTAARRRFRPVVENLEDRCVLSLFLQGQVINDVTLAPQAGAIITLEDSSGNPILNGVTPITTVSDAAGNYRFDSTNTFGALVAGNTYRLLE